MARRVLRDSSRRSPFRPATQLECLESRMLLSGLTPAGLTGGALVALETSGAGTNQSPPDATVFHFTSTNVVVYDLYYTDGGGSASYTYHVTGSTTATVVGVAPDGTHTLYLTFATATTGTLHEVDPNGTQDANFVWYAAGAPNLAPNAINQNSLLMDVVGGGGQMPHPGTYRVIPASSGNTYQTRWVGNSGNDRAGTYTYTYLVNNVPGLATFAYVEPAISGTAVLAFTSATGGYFYNSDASTNGGLSDYQYGTFTVGQLATHLAFAVQPSAVGVGATMGAVQVSVLDSQNQVVSEENSNVTLSVASGPGLLSGTLTQAAVNGVATFTGLSLGTVGTYTLAASDTGLTGAVSDGFAVFAPATVSTNLIERDPSGTGATVFNFQVKFTDASVLVESSLTGAGTIYVTGPNGFNQPATFVSANPTGNAATITATYQIAVNGGNTWTANQEGIYAVNVTGGQVADGSGARANASTVGFFFYSYNPLFSERYYLTKYTDIFNAVMAGQFTSGYQHYKLYGEAEGRNPSSFFDEQFYRKQYPGVNAAVIAGQFKSGFDHFVQYGAAAQYQSSLFFNQQYYLRKYPGVAAAITAGTFHSALEHFMISGQYEGYDPCIYFDTAYYLSHNTDVATAIGNGTIVSAFEHFVDYGLAEGRAAIATFSESYYLAHNADVAAAVTAGTFLSGYAHFITNGQYEVVQTGPGTYLGERNPSTLFDSGFYLTHYPDIAQAVMVDHSFASAFIHYLWAGAAEGRLGHA